MKVLGIDFSCALGALSNGQFPEKDCLLPLISTLLGYAIVAASTTVKLPQNKSTGELSFLTNFMNFGGSMVRVFTSIQEQAPKSVLLGSVLGVATNSILLSQILIYQKPKSRAEKEKKKE